MRDKDIKKIFNNAVEGDNDANIDTEKIQNTVMERLGKLKGDSLYLSDSEDAVKPVFVTAPVKKPRRIPVFIASAAAACLVITAVCTGFFGMRVNLSGVIGSSLASELTGLPEADTAQEHIAAQTPDVSEKTEAVETVQEQTAPSEETKINDTEASSDEGIINLKDIPNEMLPLKNNSFTLLDGHQITVDGDCVKGSGDRLKLNWLLSEDGGRVYYWNGKEKKDITELIGDDTVYIDSYENDGSGLTHYIVIGGDAASGKYGYAEIFRIRELKWQFCIVCNRKENASESYDEQDIRDEVWEEEVHNSFFNLTGMAIKQISGDEHIMYGGGFTWTDFTTVTLPCDR